MKRARMGFALAIGLLMIGGQSCGSDDRITSPAEPPQTDPGYSIVPSVLDLQEGHGPAVLAPASAKVGEAIGITIRTFALGCESKGPTQIELSSPLAVRVEPYTIRAHADACPDWITYPEHRVALLFDTSGTASIDVVAFDPASGATEVHSMSIQVEP